MILDNTHRVLSQSMGSILHLLVIVAVSLLSIIAVSCNVVTANYINDSSQSGVHSKRRRQRHLTTNNNGGDNITTFIVGGTETNKGDFPYLVSIGNSGRRGGHGK